MILRPGLLLLQCVLAHQLFQRPFPLLPQLAFALLPTYVPSLGREPHSLSTSLPPKEKHLMMTHIIADNTLIFLWATIQMEMFYC